MDIRDGNLKLQGASLELSGTIQQLGGENFVILEASSGSIIRAAGASLPARGSGGFYGGCLLYIFATTGTAALLGACPLFINAGSETACEFIPIGSQSGYGFYRAGGGVASAGGDATETIVISDAFLKWDIAAVGFEASNDTDSILSALLTNKTLTIVEDVDPSTAHAYNYAIMRKGCMAEFDVVFAGTHVCIGGAAAEAITIAGVLATDIAFVQYAATDDTDTIAKAVTTANTLTVTMSANPATAHSLHYMILRPRGTRQPSHYIAYAGLHTSVGGDPGEILQLPGVLATDIPICGYSVTNDTDKILKAVATANILTITCTADPSTAHGFWYLLLRAY